MRRVHGEGARVIRAVSRLDRRQHEGLRRDVLQWGREWNAWRADDPSPMWNSTYVQAARFQRRLSVLAQRARAAGARGLPRIDVALDREAAGDAPGWLWPVVVGGVVLAALLWSPPSRAASRAVA